MYEDEQYLYQALRAGASGYVLKRVEAAELVGHLQRVMDGEVMIDPTLAGRIAMSAARLNAGEFWPGAHLGLTQRESEVLSLLVANHSNKGIAAKLVVSEDTVKTHIRGLYRKLAVSDRGGAVAVALREGLFRDRPARRRGSGPGLRQLDLAAVTHRFAEELDADGAVVPSSTRPPGSSAWLRRTPSPGRTARRCASRWGTA